MNKNRAFKRRKPILLPLMLAATIIGITSDAGSLVEMVSRHDNDKDGVFYEATLPILLQSKHEIPEGHIAITPSEEARKSLLGCVALLPRSAVSLRPDGIRHYVEYSITHLYPYDTDATLIISGTSTQNPGLLMQNVFYIDVLIRC